MNVVTPATASLVERLDSANPVLLRLAEAVSLAVVVDPRLLRTARFSLSPVADAGIEADLWFSPLVESSNPQGFTLLAGALQALWQRLRGDQDRLEQVWRMTSSVHSAAAPAVRLAEELIWLGLSTRRPRREALIDERLHQALVAMVRDDRRSLARWVLRNLPRLPIEVRSAPNYERLAWAAMARMPNAPAIMERISTQAFEEWLPSILPVDFDSIDVGVRRSKTGLVFAVGSAAGDFHIVLPRVEPLLIGVAQGGSAAPSTIVSLGSFRDRTGAAETAVPVGRGAVLIRTARGDVYEIPALEVEQTPEAPPPAVEPQEQESVFAPAPPEVDPLRLGVIAYEQGVNVAIYSVHAPRVEFCIFDPLGRRELHRMALPERTGDIWHGFITTLTDVEKTTYGFRVHGPYEPERGHRFNPNKLLIDPYARRLTGRFTWSDAHFGYRVGNPRQDLTYDRRDNARGMPKCLPFTPGARPAPRGVRVPWERTILYQLHVKGVSMLHTGVPRQERGCFAGVASPAVVRHITGLGVTSVILSPVQEFIDNRSLVDRGLHNYYGASPIGFFAVATRFAAGDPASEFRQMVARLHQAGLEVIISVTYGSTAEGNQLGPTLSLRGIDNASFYLLQPDQPRYYVDATGTGNALNFDQPAVRQLVLDSLRYWVEEMGVDGFLFESAVTLGRGPSGYNAGGASILQEIRRDPILSRVKLIAEPWDVGPGGYQLGGFPSGWSELNDQFRDTIRKFWRGDAGQVPNLARVLCASSEIFQSKGRDQWASVNAVCLQDGFTLADLVSYSEKHNEANGENNSDGISENYSANYGVEGPTADPEVLLLRARQKRNLLTTLMLARGTPLLLMGDELSRTQRGNNNAYCQDNEISWMDWQRGAAADADLLPFVRNLIALRKRLGTFARRGWLVGRRPDGFTDVWWLSPEGREMQVSDWQFEGGRALGMQVGNDGPESDRLLLLFNAAATAIQFRLLDAIGGPWALCFDTREPRGTVQGAPIVVPAGGVFTLDGHSVAVFQLAKGPRSAART